MPKMNGQLEISIFQTVPIKQHYTLDDRRKAAQLLANSFVLDFPIFIDDPTTNAFQIRYSPWPLRWYIIDEHGVLVFIGQPQHASFSFRELEEHLE